MSQKASLSASQFVCARRGADAHRRLARRFSPLWLLVVAGRAFSKEALFSVDPSSSMSDQFATEVKVFGRWCVNRPTGRVATAGAAADEWTSGGRLHAPPCLTVHRVSPGAMCSRMLLLLLLLAAAAYRCCSLRCALVAPLRHPTGRLSASASAASLLPPLVAAGRMAPVPPAALAIRCAHPSGSCCYSTHLSSDARWNRNSAAAAALGRSRRVALRPLRCAALEFSPRPSTAAHRASPRIPSVPAGPPRT